MWNTCVVGFLSAACLAAQASAGGFQFVPLGDLPGGSFSSAASELSDDGQVVIGTGVSGQYAEGFRWTAETGMVSLGFIPGGREFSFPQNVSGDGSVVIGYAGSAVVPTSNNGFKWTAATGMVEFGDLPGSPYGGSPWGASFDGSTIVGNAGYGFNNAQATRWTPQTGIQGIGFLPPNGTSSVALATSDDGSIVVGSARLPAGSMWHAYRWTAASGMVDLGAIPPNRESQASHITGDGAAIFGYNRGHGREVFRWTDADGMVILPQITLLHDAGRDGNFLVGGCDPEYWRCIWDEANHGRNFADLLLAGTGIDFSSTCFELSGVSGDGRAVCGWYCNADGNPEAFLLRLPLPGDVSGDGNGDLQVDAEDAKPFANCMRGPAAPGGNVCRRAADLDADHDTDLHDFALLQRLITPDDDGG
jgi:probable HAF family extracellular repeat protein